MYVSDYSGDMVTVMVKECTSHLSPASNCGSACCTWLLLLNYRSWDFILVE
jgi:hypothetical protein